MSDETQQPNSEPAPISTESQNSEENFTPQSPSEPVVDASIPTQDSVSVEMPPQPLESPTEVESVVPLKDQNDANEPLNPAPEPEISVDPNNPNITIEKHGNDITITEVMQPTAHSEPATAQMTGNEPLAAKRKENLERANLKRQTRKREKINEILDLFTEKQKVTNDEVEKLLHVSDATATRYLETLEKEGKIKQVGKTGKHTHYEKI